MTEARLDPARIDALRAYAEGGVQTIDPVAIATTAMESRARWRLTKPRRSLVLVLTLIGLLLATAIAIGVSGTLRAPMPPQVFTPLDVPAIDSLSVAARLPDGRVLIVGSFDRRRLLEEALERGEEQWRAVGLPAAWLLDPDAGTFTRTGDPLSHTSSQPLPPSQTAASSTRRHSSSVCQPRVPGATHLPRSARRSPCDADPRPSPSA